MWSLPVYSIFFFTLDSLSLSGTHVRSVRTGSYAPGSSGAGNRLLYMCSHELEKFFTFSQGQIWRSCMCTYYGHFPVHLQVGSIFAGSFPEQRLVLDPNMQGEGILVPRPLTVWQKAKNKCMKPRFKNVNIKTVPSYPEDSWYVGNFRVLVILSFRPFFCSASELFLGFFSGFKVRLLVYYIVSIELARKFGWY